MALEQPSSLQPNHWSDLPLPLTSYLMGVSTEGKTTRYVTISIMKKMNDHSFLLLLITLSMVYNIYLDLLTSNITQAMVSDGILQQPYLALFWLIGDIIICLYQERAGRRDEGWGRENKGIEWWEMEDSGYKNLSLDKARGATGHVNSLCSSPLWKLCLLCVIFAYVLSHKSPSYHQIPYGAIIIISGHLLHCYHSI